MEDKTGVIDLSLIPALKTMFETQYIHKSQIHTFVERTITLKGPILKEDDPCVICFDNKKACILIHRLFMSDESDTKCEQNQLCTNCAIRISREQASCPFCRKDIHYVKMKNGTIASTLEIFNFCHDIENLQPLR